MNYRKIYVDEFEAAIAEVDEHAIEIQVARRRSDLVMIQTFGPFLGLAGALFVGLFFNGKDVITLIQSGVMILFLMLAAASMTMYARSATVRCAAAEDALDVRKAQERSSGQLLTGPRQGGVFGKRRFSKLFDRKMG